MTDKEEEGKFKYQSDDKSVDENFGNGKDMPWFTGMLIKNNLILLKNIQN